MLVNGLVFLGNAPSPTVSFAIPTSIKYGLELVLVFKSESN